MSDTRINPLQLHKPTLAKRLELDEEAQRFATARDAARRQRTRDLAVKSDRAARNLFKSARDCKLDERVQTDCTNAGISNQHVIKAAQEKARADIAAGGRVLPRPNPFRAASTRYGTAPGTHTLNGRLGEGPVRGR